MSGTKYLVYSEYDSQGNKILKRAETLSENLVCNGKIGIGDLISGTAPDTPKAELHLNNRTDSGSDRLGAGLLFSRYWNSDTDTRASGIWHEYNTGTDKLCFKVTGNSLNRGHPIGLGNASMVLTDTGRLGIGTTSPVTKLHIDEATSNHCYLRISGKTANQQAIEFYDESGTAWIMYKDATTRKLNFHNGSGNKLTLLQNGNVGIGATDPFAKLDVKGTYTATIPALGLNNGGGGTSGPTGSSMPQIMLGYNGTTNDYAHTISTRHHGSSAQQNAIDFYVHQGSGGAGSSVTKLRHNMTMNGGRVGIGLTSPGYPLHVGGSTVSSGNHNFQAWLTRTSHGDSASGNNNIAFSLKCDNAIWAGTSSNNSHTGVWVSSDIRIKTDVEDVVDDSALVAIRNLKPKKYRYIISDDNNNNNKVYGFLAQEVKAVIPEAVFVNTEEFIPSIWEKVQITFSDNSKIGTIMLINKDTSGLSVDTEVQLITDRGNKLAKITDISGSKTFSFSSEEFKELDIVVIEGVQCGFVFGPKVNDFHTMKKDAIWTVATAALQEVDRQLQAEKAKVATLETEMAAIKAHLGI